MRPLTDVLRYGKARSFDAGQLGALIDRIAAQGAIQLQFAARNLDAETSRDFANVLKEADGAVRLTEDAAELTPQWNAALARVSRDDNAARLVMGAAARLLYEADAMTAEEATVLLGRALSPGTDVADAAAYFEGFFEGSGQRLLYDAALRDCVDGWVISLDEEVFTEHLPLFRRVLSALDWSERKRLLDALFGRQPSGVGHVLASMPRRSGPPIFDRLTGILQAGARDG